MIKISHAVYGVTGLVMSGAWYVILKSNYHNKEEKIKQFALVNVFSILAYIIVNRVIPVFMEFNKRGKLFGRDLNKKGTPAGDIDIPESLGIVPATVFILVNICSLLLIQGRTPDNLAKSTAALLSICLIILLGFADDVMDLPWRYKLIIPPVASLPLLVMYGGGTSVILPTLIRPLLGRVLDLGILYYIYMLMLAVFATNSINIYAGINGLEVSQSIIIALAVVVHNIIEIHLNIDNRTVDLHFFSLIVILVFLACILALFKYNKYPSKVFVGDTFCYFAGMTLAVVGILNHFSKTLFLFFVPQILNFLFSLPQILKIIPCPRHRLPKYNTETKLLECVKNHFTLLNAFLFVKGPTSEENLCTYMVFFQIFCCGVGFFVRYVLSMYFF